MKNDNTTPITASEYDKKINNTIPYYSEFYNQTLDVIEQCGYSDICWMDLGCGTGSLAEKAMDYFDNIRFVLVDSSEKMLEQSEVKLKNFDVEYSCEKLQDVRYNERFHVITAIQAMHYLQEDERYQAIKNVYSSLREGGIFINFENVIPEDEDLKTRELLRWGRYQQRHGKTAKEAEEHNKRCGVNYFPLTIREHFDLLKKIGFQSVHVFWVSYMQMGIYAIK